MSGWPNPFERDDLNLAYVVAGADWTPPAAHTSTTPAQLWGRLLLDPEEKRLERLGILLDLANERLGCIIARHVDQLNELTEEVQRLRMLELSFTDNRLS